MKSLCTSLVLGALVVGCSGGPVEPTVTISSAPLTLPGIGHACYDIAVTNAAEAAKGGWVRRACTG